MLGLAWFFMLYMWLNMLWIIKYKLSLPKFFWNKILNIKNPVLSAINLETTDRWGVNRRNIITYEIMGHREKVHYSTLVKIWASKCRGTPDNIIFNKHLIKGNSLPKIPQCKF